MELTDVSCVIVDGEYGLDMDQKQAQLSPGKDWDFKGPVKDEMKKVFRAVKSAPWIKPRFKIICHCNTLYITQVRPAYCRKQYIRK